MPLRIVEILLPKEDASSVDAALADLPVHSSWSRELADGRMSVAVLIEAHQAEAVLDRLDHRFVWGDRARLLLLDVEATRPKIEGPPPPKEAPNDPDPGADASDSSDEVPEAESFPEVAAGEIAQGASTLARPQSSPTPSETDSAQPGATGTTTEGTKNDDKKESSAPRLRLPNRISRDELLEALLPGTRPSPVYFLTVLLSSTIAVVGIVRNDVAILVGAMVIAPLLGPNMALAFGNTLGDVAMIRGASRTAVSGVAVALGFSIALGFFLPENAGMEAMRARVEVDFGDVVLATCAGAAGALAFTSGVPAGLVGVMVAVALLPPTVVFGLLIGQGKFAIGIGAGLIVATNIICVNLSAMLTFILQGIRPQSWWEEGRARRARRRAALVWGLLLAALVAIIALTSLSS